MIKDKSIHMNYVDLDIISDGLFILSCLGELDVHRKVRKITCNKFHIFLC